MKRIRLCLPCVLTSVLGIAVFASLQLSLKEWNTPGSCPSIGPVPICYLVLFSFVLALAGHLTTFSCWGRKIFLVGLGFPSILALYASIGEFFGFVQCPTTDGGTPTCYISLALCLTCWVLWLAARKNTNPA